MGFKKNWLGFSFLFCAAAVNAAPAPFSLTVDLAGKGALNLPGSSFSPGIGGYLSADWRALDWLALGVGGGYSSYFKSGSLPAWQTSSVDLGGKIFPFGSNRDGELYLQGGAGYNFLSGTENSWFGHFHGFAGLGYHFFLSPGTALDLGAQYDMFTPLSDSLSVLTAKAGLAFFFGGKNEAVESKAPAAPQPIVAAEAPPQPTPQPTPLVTPETAPAPPPAPEAAPAVSAPEPKTAAAAIVMGHRPGYHWTQPKRKKYAPIRYRWRKNSTLEKVAEAVYGEACDYPILVDANKASLGGPAGLAEGTVILLPQDVRASDLNQACQKAEEEKYKAWKEVR